MSTNELVGTRLDSDDAARLWLDMRHNPMVVTAVLELDGTLGREALVELVEQRIVAHERFRLLPTWPHLPLRKPRWARPRATSAAAHVDEVSLGDRDDATLARAASKIAAKPLAARLSPWLVTLVHRTDPTSGRATSALVVRIHHVLADGVALMRVLFGFSDEGASTVASSDSATASASAAPDPAHHAESFHAGARLREAARLIASEPAARLGGGRLTGKRRLAWTRALDLNAIRDAARARHVRVNDLLLAAVATAIRARANDVELARRFVAMVPVALHHDDELANKYTSVFVELPTRNEDPEMRVAAAKAAMQRALDGATLAAGAGLRGLGVALGGRIERIGARFVSRKASLVLSNLAGPPAKLHIGGRAIDSIVFASPSAGTVPLSISAFSYAGVLRVNVAIDAGFHHDEHALARAVEDALRSYFSGA